MLAHYAATRRDVDAGNGVALLRHRTRCSSTAAPGRLLHLIQLCHHHDLDIGGDLIQQAAQYAEEAANLSNGVAHGMPSDRRLCKPKRLHDTLLNRQALFAEGSKRSYCASEFTHEDTSLHLIEALKKTGGAGKPPRRFISKGKRHSLLQIAPADHRSVAMFFGEVSKRGGDCLHFVFDKLECGADLQNRGGVRYILGRCTPMAPLPEIIFTKRS